MNELILIKCGELVLKGLNRGQFESTLIRNIKRAVSDFGKFKIYTLQSTIYMEPLNEDTDIHAVMKRIAKVFGIAAISRALICKKDLEDIKGKCFSYLEESLMNAKSFKVTAKRSDKSFPYTSIQISSIIGGHIAELFPHIKVDVHNPEVTITVEIRDLAAFLRAGEIKGAGGMPTGSNGRAALLLSGGIDSPVAGYMVAKRGVDIDAIHFFSYPYTSERAKLKVIELAKILSGFTGRVKLFVVPFTKIQEEIKKSCPEELFTLVMRRFMMKIAEKIAKSNNCQALITGESIGQVASQTISALGVTDNAVSMPVFRPVIGMDKDEIVVYARKIDTFETSILPYEDCCTVFAPKHPKLKPNLEEILEAEHKMNSDELVDEAVEQAICEDIGGRSRECRNAEMQECSTCENP